VIVVCRQRRPNVDIVQRMQRVAVRQDGRRIAVEQVNHRTVVAQKASVGMRIQIGGLQGPPGPGDKNYVHTQASPSALWIVQHNLGKFPSVSVFDSGGDLVEGDVIYDSLNQCTLTFSGAFSGKATCN